MIKIQYPFKRNKVAHEVYKDEKYMVMPDNRFPKLAEIVAMFTQGRPLDASLQCHLDYNDLERNPIFEKGLDLADMPRIAKEINSTLQQVNEEVERAKVAKKSKQEQIADPSIQSPEHVE